MQRWMVILGIAAVAAFAIWHPVGHASSALVEIPAAKAGRFTTRTRGGGFASVKMTGAVVYVVGAVARPGLYTLHARARVDDAVRAAGGLLADADPAGVNLAALAVDGDEIYAPRVGEAPRTATRSRSPRVRRTLRRSAAPPPQAVDPNSADAQTLASVPGLGVTLAARIVTYREVNGPFGSLDELLDVAGMTPAKLDRAGPYLQLDSGG